MKRTKRMLSVLLALALMLSGLPMYGMEARAESAGDFIYTTNIDGNSVTIMGYMGSGGDAVIPSEIDGKSVTEIEDGAFRHCHSLVSVIIPASVTSIGDYAFADCSSLEEIIIPEGVTSIGKLAFEGCSSLSVITVAEGNTKYDSRENCNAIIETRSNTLIGGCKKTVIPDGVRSIGNYAFAGCSGLTEISIPASVRSIGWYAFYGCSGLTEINIPASVTTISKYAFRDCSGLADITVDENNTKYDSRENSNAIIETKSNTLLYGCKNTTIPSGVTKIEEYAFEESSLASVDIPDSVTSIGEGAFMRCCSLTEIYIPDSVESIDYDVFLGCSGLATITVGKGNPIYDSRDNCNAIIETESNTLFYGCKNTKIPDSVTSIGDCAFYECSGLTEISIPDSVTSIGVCAFDECSLASVSIPDSVTSIGMGAFWGCSSLTEISIPDSVTSIEEDVFRDCGSLAAITVAEGNTTYDSRKNCNAIIETESNTLISGCKNTKIPDGVKKIGYSAFQDCSGLTEISIPDSVTSIGYYAFRDCSSLASVSILSSVESIGNYAFAGCSSLTEISIPGSVTSIGYYAFAECSSLEEISIPGSVTSIGDYAFAECSSLENVSMSSGVTSINMGAFWGCGLTEVSIPDSVTNIESGAFGYSIFGLGGLKVKIPGFVIHGKSGSTAETYANENGFTFEAVSENDISWADVILEPESYTYDGQAKEPLVTVTVSGETLDPDTDYTVSYGNNTDAGQAKVTVTGTGSYTGTVKKPYTISKADITAAAVTLEPESYTYDGQEKKPSVTVKLEENELSADTDYTVSYGNNTDAGQAKVTVNGTGNYTGIVEKPYIIGEADISAAAVTLEPESYIYDGQAKKPSVTVTLSGKELSADTDYTVSYSDNTNAGQAKATVSGAGNYSGTVEKPYTISAADITAADVALSPTGYTYDGTEKKPSVTVTLSGKELSADTDYTVSYSDNTNAGQAKATVSGTGNYTGTVEKPYTIGKADISQAAVTLDQTSYTYDGTAKTPSVTVTLSGRELVLNTDYTVSYSNNTNAGTAAVTVEGKGSYTGTAEKPYTIGKADISQAAVTLSPTSYTYDGTAKTPSVTVTLSGKTLVPDTDYTVSYSNNTNAGTATATVTAIGNYTGNKAANFAIVEATENTGENTNTSITCRKTVYKVAYGAKPFKINATSKSKLTFTSSSSKIAAVDKNTGTVIIKGTGIATITVKAGNNSVKVTVKVSPKKATLKKVKAAKGKKLTVKWAKDKKASGYQVQISTSKNFKKNVKKKNVKKISYTFKKLKAGKKYYVRVRSYKKSGKEKLYGAWSSKKKSGKVKK